MNNQEKPKDKDNRNDKWSRRKKLILVAAFIAAVGGCVEKGVDVVSTLRHENMTHHRELPSI